jgi:hypothetical protein
MALKGVVLALEITGEWSSKATPGPNLHDNEQETLVRDGSFLV